MSVASAHNVVSESGPAETYWQLDGVARIAHTRPTTHAADHTSGAILTIAGGNREVTNPAPPANSTVHAGWQDQHKTPTKAERANVGYRLACCQAPYCSSAAMASSSATSASDRRPTP